MRLNQLSTAFNVPPVQGIIELNRLISAYYPDEKVIRFRPNYEDWLILHEFTHYLMHTRGLPRDSGEHNDVFCDNLHEVIMKIYGTCSKYSIKNEYNQVMSCLGSKCK